MTQNGMIRLSCQLGSSTLSHSRVCLWKMWHNS